jgi:hypothetical protein
MFKRVVLILGLVLLTLFLTIPAAVNAAPFDPVVPIGPLIPIVLDPCLFADYVATMSSHGSYVVAYDAGDNYHEEFHTWQLSVSGAGLTGQLVSEYKRMTTASGSFVHTEDTIIVPDQFTVFGRAYKTATGYTDAQGVIVGVIDANGNQIDVKGTYLYTDDDRMCFFVQ